MGENMLFKKKTTRDLHAQSMQEGSGKLNVKKGSALDNQLNMIGLTVADLNRIHALQPFVEEEIIKIVDRFYKTRWQR